MSNYEPITYDEERQALYDRAMAKMPKTRYFRIVVSVDVDSEGRPVNANAMSMGPFQNSAIWNMLTPELRAKVTEEVNEAIWVEDESLQAALIDAQENPDKEISINGIESLEYRDNAFDQYNGVDR